MSRTRFSRFVVAILALALWAGTAYGQATSYTFTGPTGGLLNAASTNFTVTPVGGTYTGTITITPSGGGLTASNAQVLTFSGTSTAQTVTFTPTAVGPVTLTPVSSPALGTDPSALTYNTPSAAPTIGTATAGNASASVAFTAVPSANNGGSAITLYTATCTGNKTGTGASSPVTVSGLTNGSSYTCTVTATNGVGVSAASAASNSVTPALGQPLVPSVTPVPLSFTLGTTTLNPNTSTIKVASGAADAPFALDQSTVPIWLTVTVPGTAANPGADSSSGIQVSFAGSSATVLQGMAPGNYTAHVGFLATGATGELTIPVVMTISSAAGGTISLEQGTTQIDIFTPPGTVPVPVVTPISNSGPIPFTASCTVVSTGYSGATPCKLTTGDVTPGQTAATAAQSITGVAYNTPTPISTVFDSALFVSRPLGTVITLTVTVAQSESVSVSLAYQYTLQYGAPTIASGSPTSVQSNLATLGNPLVVTLKGTNFVAPSGLAAGATIVGTQVFVGAAVGSASGTNLTAIQGAVDVLNSTTIMVSVPTANFPASPAKTLVIGVANEQVTDGGTPTKPQATYTVNFTTSPVVYAITSTASYNQPGIGGSPNVAPYELISIFGANFGVDNVSPNDPNNGIGTQDAFGKYLTTVNASGAGSASSKYVTLAVSFKNVTGTKSTTYAAPILFANATQINAIVPSQVPLTGVTTVTVTYGTLSSDGLFAVNIVAADPGIFTLASSGTGQGAILNQNYSVNGSSSKAVAGQYVSIYMTGLGVPDSTTDDLAAGSGSSLPTGFPAACVAVTNPAKNHAGYMEDVNTKVAANAAANPPVAAYTPPSPAWTTIDGAVINSARIVTGLYPPCFMANGTTDTITVTFGSGSSTYPVVSTASSSPILWAGFGDGSVAGLYQVSVVVPAGLAGAGQIPVQFSMTTGAGTFSSNQVVTMYVQ
jgi:uncharacterized protein (TIGR03437 family)